MMTLCLVLAVSVSAAEPSLLVSRPQKALANEVIELKPIAGHHFNIEAPQKCGGAKADSVTPRRFRCQMRAAGRVEVVASVCDDAKSFCRQERFEVNVPGAWRRMFRAARPPKPHAAPDGFLINQPQKALARARKTHAPLFVHFFGIWCPPCNMLEEAVYPGKEFQNAAAPFIKLALDADAELSWDWKARYKIGGYPTLLVLDERGREISRAVGYRSTSALKAFLNESKFMMSEPVEKAAKDIARSAPAENGARRARVARWRLERGEYALALKAAGTAPEARRQALLARKERAEKEDDAPALTNALKELTAERRGDPELTEWATDLAERDKPAAEALADAVRASSGRWAGDISLGEHGLVPGDIHASEALFWEALGRAADAKASWFSAALAYDAEATASPLGLARGANIERAYCLQKAGRLEEARALYASLVGAYPDEFTFHYGYGRLLLELKEYQSALASAHGALKNSYGDNWLRAVALEAKILKALDRKEDMARSLDMALAEASAPKSTAVRTHRYLAELRRLRAEL